MMDSRLLTFLMLVQTKSYTKTAQALFITQPAVTHHIKTLEKDNNVKLFANTKTFRLSIEGQIIYDYAKKCELMHEQLKAALSNQANSKQLLNFSTTKQIAAIVMNRVLIDWMKIHPKDKISMGISDFSEIQSQIHAGEIDFAIIDQPYDSTIFKGSTLLELSASLYVGPSHPLAHKQKITLEQLKKETLIADCHASGARMMLDSALKKHNMSVATMPYVIEINDPTTIKDMTLNNLGIALIYDDFVVNEVKKNKLFKINLENENFVQKVNVISSVDSLLEKQIANITNDIVNFYKQSKGK